MLPSVRCNADNTSRVSNVQAGGVILYTNRSHGLLFNDLRQLLRCVMVNLEVIRFFTFTFDLKS